MPHRRAASSLRFLALLAVLGTALEQGASSAAADGFWDEVREPGIRAHRAHLSRARRALLTRRIEIALEATSQAIALLPDAAEAHTMRAVALAESGDVRGAAGEVTRALELDESAFDDPTWALRISDPLLGAGHHELLSRVLRRTVASMPATHVRRHLYTTLGDAAQAAGSAFLDESVRAYRTSLRSGPADTRCVLGLALALRRRSHEANGGSSEEDRVESEILARRAAAPGGLEGLVSQLPIVTTERAARLAIAAQALEDAERARQHYLAAAESVEWGAWARAEIENLPSGDARRRRGTGR